MTKRERVYWRQGMRVTEIERFRLFRVQADPSVPYTVVMEDGCELYCLECRVGDCYHANHVRHNLIDELLAEANRQEEANAER